MNSASGSEIGPWRSRRDIIPTVDPTPTGFFAYPTEPANSGQAIEAFIISLEKQPLAKITSWKSLRVGGQVLWLQIAKAIETADFFCADITGLNPNVLFELGYAIGKQKREWIVVNLDSDEHRAELDQFRLLKTTGYARFSNALQLGDQFRRDYPYADLDSKLFEYELYPQLNQPGPYELPLLFYASTRKQTQIDLEVSTLVKSSGIRGFEYDPTELDDEPLSSLVHHLFNSLGFLACLASPTNTQAKVDNARTALLAGLALGFDMPILILAPMDLMVPIDYRDLVKTPVTPALACERVAQFIAPLMQIHAESKRKQSRRLLNLEMLRGLGSIYLGEVQAEAEEGRLAEYFFEWPQFFNSALEGKHMLVTGRKGTGKSANRIMMTQELQKDPRTFTCIMKPQDYQIGGVIDFMGILGESFLRNFASQSIWKFLIYTELAAAISESIDQRPSKSPFKEEEGLLRFLSDRKDELTGAFPVRLERVLSRLFHELSESHASLSQQQFHEKIANAFHMGLIQTLRHLVGAALAGRDRVVILVDNLDRAWDASESTNPLSSFLGALINVIDPLTEEMRTASKENKSINVSLVVFLRSDIFYWLKELEREPDKLNKFELSWTDKDALLSIVERRFLASDPTLSSPAEVWSKYFWESTGEVSARDAVFQAVRPRPRDIIYLVRDALKRACLRGHTKILVDDLRDAELEYSTSNAVPSLLPELAKFGVSRHEINRFMKTKPIVSATELSSMFENADIDQITRALVAVGFLEQEIAEGDFRFAEEVPQLERFSALAAKHQALGHEQRFRIRRCFWPYLVITDQG